MRLDGEVRRARSARLNAAAKCSWSEVAVAAPEGAAQNEDGKQAVRLCAALKGRPGRRPSATCYDALMSELSDFEVGLAFAQQVTGTTIEEGPADPASPLGALQALAAEHGSDVLTPSHVADAIAGRPLKP
jgi:hypothetical protein